MPLYDTGHNLGANKEGTALVEQTLSIDDHKIEHESTEYHLKSTSVGNGSSLFRMTSALDQEATITVDGGEDTTSNFSAVLNLEDGAAGNLSLGVYSDGGPPSGWANGDGELAFGTIGLYFDISERGLLLVDGAASSVPDASALMEFRTTTAGVLFPRMTTTQRNNISTPADGLVIYNTTDSKLQVRAASAWVNLH